MASVFHPMENRSRQPMRMIALRGALALAIAGGFVLVPGMVQAEDCALSPGAAVVFGSDTCSVDPSEFAIALDPTTAVDSIDNALTTPDPAVDDQAVPDGQWDWPAPTGDEADPN
jgi:hypothetical protein